MMQVGAIMVPLGSCFGRLLFWFFCSIATVFLFENQGVLAQPPPPLSCLEDSTISASTATARVAHTLKEGQFIQNGECMDAQDAVWYYDLQPAPITSNGLEAGAPTHFHLNFGSIGNPIRDAFDYQKYGLYIPGEKGNMTIELSPQFLYYSDVPQLAQGMWTTEMGTGPANILFSSPCLIDVNTERGQTVCAGWVSELMVNSTATATDDDDASTGDNATTGPTTTTTASQDGKPNTIVVFAPDGLFGGRALQIGVKFFHLHPVIELGAPIFFNANGTCSKTSATSGDGNTDDVVYCRFDSDCPNHTAKNGTTTNDVDDIYTCVPAVEPLTGSVTVTLYDETGAIQHMGTRSYTFDTEPNYRVSTTNTKVACNWQLHEMVDFQRVPPYSNVTITETIYEDENTCIFNATGPYAPRFFLFGPNANKTTAFPQPQVEDLRLVPDSNIGGTLYNGDVELGFYRLYTEPEGIGGSIFMDHANLGMVRHGPKRIGGTIFAIPIEVGGPGRYMVEVTLTVGPKPQAATTTIIVEEPGGGSSGRYSMMATSWQMTLWWALATSMLYFYN